MKKKQVGTIKNVIYNDDFQSLDVLVRITDSKFKKKLLRDLSLSGNIKFVNNKLIYIDNNEDE